MKKRISTEFECFQRDLLKNYKQHVIKDMRLPGGFIAWVVVVRGDNLTKCYFEFDYGGDLIYVNYYSQSYQGYKGPFLMPYVKCQGPYRMHYVKGYGFGEKINI